MFKVIGIEGETTELLNNKFVAWFGKRVQFSFFIYLFDPG